MGVRLKLRVEYSGKSVEVIALANTGYEGEVPELMVTVDVAKRLGIWPRLPEDTLTAEL